jgi:transcriptional regulator with XRE-family HTH domain
MPPVANLVQPIVNLHTATPMPRRKNPRINDYFIHNRVIELMAHTTRYAFKCETRLAHDAGVSKSAVCRLVLGRTSPSYALVTALTRALEKALGMPLDPREMVSTDGTYPTPSVCELVGCRGCSLSPQPKETFGGVVTLKSPDIPPPIHSQQL